MGTAIHAEAGTHPHKARAAAINDETIRNLHALLTAYGIDQRWFPIYENAIRRNPEAAVLCSGVSKREMQVIIRLLQREDYQSVANELGVTKRTIAFHITKAVSKIRKILKLNELRPQDFLLKYDKLMFLPLQ